MVFDAYYHEKPEKGWLLSVSGRGFDPGETFPVRIERYPDLDDFLADIETQHAFVPWGSNPIRKWVADEQLEPVEETVGTIIGSTAKGSQFYLSIPDGLPQGNYRLTAEIDGVDNPDPGAGAPAECHGADDRPRNCFLGCRSGDGSGHGEPSGTDRR